MVETVFHDLTVNWSHTKHTCFSGPTTNLPHWTYLPIQPKPCSISTATHFYRPSYRDKIIYLTNSLRLWVIKSILKLKCILLKVRFQYSTAAAVSFVVYFTLAMCKPQVTIQTLIYFRKRCFAEMNIVATCITLSAIICVVLLYKVVVSVCMVSLRALHATPNISFPCPIGIAVTFTSRIILSHKAKFSTWFSVVYMVLQICGYSCWLHHFMMLLHFYQQLLSFSAPPAKWIINCSSFSNPSKENERVQSLYEFAVVRCWVLQYVLTYLSI